LEYEEDSGTWSDEETILSCSSTVASGEEEDPALTFVRMIYSDAEESFDEEEAFALYQAAQLMSSSDEEWYAGQDEQDRNMDTWDNKEFVAGSSEDYDGSSEEDGSSGSESGEEAEEDSDFEYTVVEYKEPTTTTTTATASPSEAASTEMDWTTWSVFDVSSDAQEIILSRNNEDTLTTVAINQGFSGDASRSIPIIAPQVLAAISAAAKSMASTQRHHPSDSSKDEGNANPATVRYFSYISTALPSDFDGENEGEFLFFEEADAVGEELCNDEMEVISFEDDAENNELYVDASSDSEEEAEEADEAEESSVSQQKQPSFDSPVYLKHQTHRPKKTSKPKRTTTISNTLLTDYRASMRRWSRVPIGAFRRSRRSSLSRVPGLANAVRAARGDWLHRATLAGSVLASDPLSHQLNTSSESDESSEQVSRRTTGATDEILMPSFSRPFNATFDDDTHMDDFTTSKVPSRSRSVISIPTQPYPLLHSHTPDWLNASWNLY